MAASNSPAHNNCARNVWLIVVSGPVLLSVLVRFRRRTRTDKSTGPLTTISHTFLAQLLCAGEFEAAIDLYAYRLADLKLTPDDAVQYDKPYQQLREEFL